MKYSWLTGTAALLLVAFLTFYALKLDQKLALTSAQLELDETLDRVEMEMIASLAVLEQMFLGFQHYLELTEQISDHDDGALRRVMDTLVLNNNYVVSLVVTDNRGNVLHWTNSGLKPNLSGRSYFDVHMGSLVDGVYLSAPLPSIMSPGQWVLGASKALRYPADESLSQVMIAIIDTRRLFSTLEKAAAESATVLTILSSRGDVFARNPDHHQIVGSNQPDLLEGWRPTSPAINSATTRVIDGRKQLLMVRQLDAYGLVIRAEMPIEAMGQQPSRLLPLVGGGAVVALLLLWQLSSMLQLQKHTKELQEQLHTETRRDPLTGLPLWLAAQDEPLTENAANPPLALLMIGLDGYSQLLADQGEEWGNMLVAQSARVMAQCQPATARLHRYLCSRFILLLPEADQAQALAVAEQMRTALAAEVFHIGSTQVSMTVSIGIAPLADDDLNPATAIKRAATALTTATNRGGNQVYWLAARESWLEQRS